MCLFSSFNLIDENMKLRKIFTPMEFFMVFLIRSNVNTLGCNNQFLLNFNSLKSRLEVRKHLDSDFSWSLLSFPFFWSDRGFLFTLLNDKLKHLLFHKDCFLSRPYQFPLLDAKSEIVHTMVKGQWLSWCSQVLQTFWP